MKAHIKHDKFTRRETLRTIAGTAVLSVLGSTIPLNLQAARSARAGALKGNIQHSVCRWCFSDISLEELSRQAYNMGIRGMDLLDPDEWETAGRYGLECAIAQGAGLGITRGFNDPDLHQELIRSYLNIIPKMAEAGIRQIICFSGNRNGISDEQGLENCAKGLKRLMPEAEKYGVRLVMELLNSKVDHADYQCDHTAWGVELCKRVGSEHFKLLYDIYHMQIMEGNVIATIRKYHPFISHYHTAGVPGRNELDETQELYYPAIIRAIQETGFEGYVAQEFIPKYPDKLGSLKAGIQVCDI